MKLLIIIDMLNGFCRKGYPLSITRSTEELEIYIETLLDKWKATNDTYLFLCDAHDKTAYEFKQYPEHCMAGTEESEIIANLKRFSTDKNILFKNTLSVFHNTRLDEYIKKTNPTEFHITGVLTDICVFFAAYEARNRGFKTFVHTKGIMALEEENESFFLDYMKKYLGVELI